MGNKVYQIITDKMIAKLQEGIVPWHKPWKQDGSAPANLVSKKAYRGINAFMLMIDDYPSQYYVTFRQCKALGGHVRRGEHGHSVIFWKFFDTENTEGDTEKANKSDTCKRIPMLRYYTVFNVDQCEGIDESKIPVVELNEIDPITECESVTESMPNPPTMREGEARAYYRPGTDTVNMPKRGLFDTAENWYCTLFHELVHSTGHTSRCGRESLSSEHRHGSDTYAKEELVAEMGAAFLCGHCGIDTDTEDNSAAYIQSWIHRFREQPKLLIQAAGQAQKAADYILNRKAAA